MQVLLQALFLCVPEQVSAALRATPDLVFQHLWLIRQTGTHEGTHPQWHAKQHSFWLHWHDSRLQHFSIKSKPQKCNLRCCAGSITQFHSIPGKGHGMMNGPAEMRILMAFWAQSLKHRPTQVSTGGPSHTSFVEVHGGADTLSSLQQQA